VLDMAEQSAIAELTERGKQGIVDGQ